MDYAPDDDMKRPVFPLPPAAFTGESRVNPPDAALDWLVRGWALFAQDKLRWCLLSLFFSAFIIIPLLLYPGIFRLFLLLLPFFAAGWHEVCRMEEIREETNDRPLPGDFFTSFTAPALIVPGILGVGALWLVWEGFLAMLYMVVSPSSDAALFWLLYILYGAFSLPILILPFVMLLLFAPPLLYPPRLSPGRALQASFTACRKNLAPLFFLALLLSLLVFATLLSFGLLLPVTLPVAFASWRAACHDIFIAL